MSERILTKHVRMIRYLKRKKGYRVGTTNGCFDLLHPGHVDFLRKCRTKLGPKGLLVVLVNTDVYLRTKGPDRPIIPESDRLAMVRSVKGVSFAYLFSESAPDKWIRRIRPDVHFKGSDWQGKDIPEARYADVEFIDLLPGYSTTSLVRRIRDGAI